MTYQRERVYRRQTINEKIEEAMADADGPGRQDRRRRDDGHAGRRPHDRRRRRIPNKKAYALASADLFFTAKLAQYTIVLRRRRRAERRAARPRDSRR